MHSNICTSTHTMTTKRTQPIIIAVGGGNAENILSVEQGITFGNKHIAEATELFGGSAVNYAMRLLCTGYTVFPILTIGNDEIGKKIHHAFIALTKKNHVNSPVLDFLISKESDTYFLDPNIKTSNTTILVQGSTRTIFTQKLRNGKYFIKQLRRRVEYIYHMTNTSPDMIMIGHIQSDSKDINPKNTGESTKYLIDHYHQTSQLFCNFGSSQIELGFEFWKSDLAKIDILQLNLEEAKRFFSSDKSKKSLQEIVALIHTLDITAIITLDRFGALGIHKKRNNSFILAWPIIDVQEVIDPTGAGDAFAAGIVSRLCDKPNFSIDEFQSAIRTGRSWAAIACKTIGGVGDCPSMAELEDFDLWLKENGAREIEIKDSENAAEIMTLLDIAFQ